MTLARISRENRRQLAESANKMLTIAEKQIVSNRTKVEAMMAHALFCLEFDEFDRLAKLIEKMSRWDVKNQHQAAVVNS